MPLCRPVFSRVLGIGFVQSAGFGRWCVRVFFLLLGGGVEAVISFSPVGGLDWWFGGGLDPQITNSGLPDVI